MRQAFRIGTPKQAESVAGSILEWAMPFPPCRAPHKPPAFNPQYETASEAVHSQMLCGIRVQELVLPVGYAVVNDYCLCVCQTKSIGPHDF